MRKMAMLAFTKIPEGLVVLTLLAVCAGDHVIKEESSVEGLSDIHDLDMDASSPIDQLAIETISNPVYALPDSNVSFILENGTISALGNVTHFDLTMIGLIDDNTPTQISLDVAVLSDDLRNSLESDFSRYDPESDEYNINTTYDQLALPSDQADSSAPVADIPVYSVTPTVFSSTNSYEAEFITAYEQRTSNKYCKPNKYSIE
ncbi:hypothetical protein SK128_016085 [Halocaridina rubra]|uniref:Uncharacterized protein n=1 Tax=Halocaridina rubra TaxID=373956 RepID=A0AAN9AHC0_HALRR